MPAETSFRLLQLHSAPAQPPVSRQNRHCAFGPRSSRKFADDGINPNAMSFQFSKQPADAEGSQVLSGELYKMDCVGLGFGCAQAAQASWQRLLLLSLLSLPPCRGWAPGRRCPAGGESWWTSRGASQALSSVSCKNATPAR